MLNLLLKTDKKKHVSSRDQHGLVLMLCHVPTIRRGDRKKDKQSVSKAGLMTVDFPQSRSQE